MAIQTTPSDMHWNYFLAIEEDLIQLSRFIEFHEDNYGCFSLECARVLLATCAEVEVVSKQICKKIAPQEGSDKKYAARRIVLSHYPEFYTHAVSIPKHGFILKPWDAWSTEGGKPEWWNAHTQVKHHRREQFAQANLKNVLNAVAGLFVMCLYLYDEEGGVGTVVLPPPKILRADVAASGRDMSDYKQRYRLQRR